MTPAELPSNAYADLLHQLGVTKIMPDKPPNLPAAAMYYAKVLGWRVFPLKPRGKTPLTLHGFKDASNVLDTVRLWWEEWPTANIGLPTGPHDQGGIGLDVIDADGPEGVAAWTSLKHRNCPAGCSTEAFCDADGGFGIVAEALTPGNSTVGKGAGRHVYVPASGRGNLARVNDQPIDYRGAGGYVVAVPSVNLVGDAYCWIRQPRVPQ